MVRLRVAQRFLSIGQVRQVSKLKNEPAALSNAEVAEFSFQDLPLKPKKPMSGFLAFCAEKFNEVRQANEPAPQVQKKLADLWKGLPEERRLKYQQKQTPALEAYGHEMDKYNAVVKQTVTIAQMVEIFDRLNKELKTSKKIIRKPSAWNIFLGEKVRETAGTGSGGKPNFTAVAGQWKALSDAEKDRYAQKAAQRG